MLFGLRLFHYAYGVHAEVVQQCHQPTHRRRVLLVGHIYELPLTRLFIEPEYAQSRCVPVRKRQIGLGQHEHQLYRLLVVGESDLAVDQRVQLYDTHEYGVSRSVGQ